MSETITLYTQSEFEKSYDFADARNGWSGRTSDKLVLVDARSMDVEDLDEARKLLNSFIDGNSEYLDPWVLAVTGYNGTESRFIIQYW